MRAAGGQQQQRQQKQRGVVVGGGGGCVCGRVAFQTQISLFSLEVYATIHPKAFSAVKSGVRRR